MLKYTPPVRDMMFGLTEMFDICRGMAAIPAWSQVSPDLVESLLEEAGALCVRRLLPVNLTGDDQGCRLEAGAVTTPEGYATAFRDFREGGWLGLFADEADGGQGLPETLNFLLHEMIMSTNLSFGDYVGLPQAAYRTIKAHGSQALRDRYLAPLVSGELGATMCMTEPQCGTDVGLIRTRALPAGDGAYRVTGTKIFISAGDQDLTGNILHLVLARLPDAPAGSRGLSLLAVPKWLPDGSRNAVQATQLEHKMGYRGAATCSMAFDGALGWLVGEANRGLRAMFVMVNTARILVALQGLGTSETAYQNAAAYARERLQGRGLGGVARPGLPADPLIVQPDVRRLLLKTRAFNEAARGLVVFVGWQLDLASGAAGTDVGRRAERLAALLTPVIKASLTDGGFQGCNDCLQIFGGHGYIRENGMEQLVRDSRIAPIQEGANGIQALDLVGRKLTMEGGQAYADFVAEVRGFMQSAGEQPDMQEFLGPLGDSLTALDGATSFMLGRAGSDPVAMGAAAYDYLRIFGLVAMAWIWSRAAYAALCSPRREEAFYRAKLLTARYFMARELPAIAGLEAAMRARPEALMEMPEELF